MPYNLAQSIRHILWVLSVCVCVFEMILIFHLSFLLIGFICRFDRVRNVKFKNNRKRKKKTPNLIRTWILWSHWIFHWTINKLYKQTSIKRSYIMRTVSETEKERCVSSKKKKKIWWHMASNQVLKIFNWWHNKLGLIIY